MTQNGMPTYAELSDQVRLLRLGLNNHGVDLMRGRSGFLSAAHSEEDIDATLAAFAATLDEIMLEHV